MLFGSKSSPALNTNLEKLKNQFDNASEDNTQVRKLDNWENWYWDRQTKRE